MKDFIDTSLYIHLSKIDDPRSGQNTSHKVTDILFIGVCAVLSGCESWYQMEDYGESKFNWLNTFLSLENGVPSHDTYRRVFSILNFETFQKAFMSWTGELKKVINITDIDQICIDGKTLRKSINKSKNIKAIHMVNAWSKNASLNLAQVCVGQKTNEIKAIPKLLEFLNIKGCLVSIDAMGCQKAIAEKIVDKKGDYLLGLKGNQGQLLAEAKELFDKIDDLQSIPFSFSTDLDIEKSHGRICKRVCETLTLKKGQKKNFKLHNDWSSLSTFIKVKRDTTNLSTGQTTEEEQFYISSGYHSAKFFNSSVRSHWEVENKLHWSLDVSMREDDDQKSVKESAKNFGLLRQFALNILRKFPDKKKRSIKRKKTMAALDENYLLKMLLH